MSWSLFKHGKKEKEKTEQQMSEKKAMRVVPAGDQFMNDFPRQQMAIASYNSLVKENSKTKKELPEELVYLLKRIITDKFEKYTLENKPLRGDVKEFDCQIAGKLGKILAGELKESVNGKMYAFLPPERIKRVIKTINGWLADNGYDFRISVSKEPPETLTDYDRTLLEMGGLGFGAVQNATKIAKPLEKKEEETFQQIQDRISILNLPYKQWLDNYGKQKREAEGLVKRYNDGAITEKEYNANLAALIKNMQKESKQFENEFNKIDSEKLTDAEKRVKKESIGQLQAHWNGMIEDAKKKTITGAKELIGLEIVPAEKFEREEKRKEKEETPEEVPSIGQAKESRF